MTQDEALHLLKLGNNIFLTGSAGSGKTYLLNNYIKYLRQHSVGVSVTASTGLAATHLNGRTIHSWSGIGVSTELSEADLNSLQRDKRVRNRYQKTKVLIIDEVSMLHAFQLDLVDRVARKMLDPLQSFGGLQIVLCGDFFQLPPVTTKQNTPTVFAFDSLAWQQGRFCTCYLHEQHRQGNDALLSVLNDIRSGSAGEHTKVPLRTRYKKQPVGTLQATRLYARNVNVDSINQRELEALSSAEKQYHMTKQGPVKLTEAILRGCPAPTVLRLKVGAKVMFVKNATDGSYVNGTLGEVESFNSDEAPVVKTFDGNTVVAEADDWNYEENGSILASISQIPLKLAWAITVHKSQGMTLDAAEMDLSDAFEPGMGYVALSRVRSLTGLNLLGLNDTALRVHPNILDRDGVFQGQSQRAAEQLASLADNVRAKQQSTVLRKRFNGKISASRPTAAETKTPERSANSASKDLTHPAKAYEPWTEIDEQTLVECFNKKMPMKVIARKLQRGTGAIRSRLKKLNLLPTPAQKNTGN